LRFLLDTHVVVWAIYEPHRISSRVKLILEDPTNELIVSHATLWELLNKVGRGQLRLTTGSVTEVFGRIQSLGITLMAVNLDDILAAASLHHYHSDPFDRMLIAQALAEGVSLVTDDKEIRQYPIQTIWA
jgi:PIN domain nuclease of toxin-antitoxin system